MRTLFITLWMLCFLTACAAGQPSVPLTVPVPTVATTEPTATLPADPTVTETATTAPTSTISPTPTPTAEVVQPTETSENFPEEIEVQELTLGVPLDEAEAEISGMAWSGDTLVLLPQFPERYEGQLFGIAKADITASIESGTPNALEPIPLAFDDGGLHTTIEGFEGFEAIAFWNQQLFVTIEARRTATTMTGYLVMGNVNADGSMRLDPTTLTEIPAAVPLENYSDEAITIADNILYTFYEANGATVNPDAIVHRFGLSALEPQAPLPLTPLEYRLTDATPADAENRFWVINYLFPGDIPKLRLADDFYKAEYGVGASHARDLGVERLIQLEITGSGIEPTDTPPVYLRLEMGNPRNWEGIALLEGQGFLLVTDKFPSTILGFVPYP